VGLAEIWVVLRLLEGELPEAEAVRAQMKGVCAVLREKKAAGVELEWGQGPTARRLGAMAGETAGKQYDVAWLKDRYGYQIAKLNAAYGLEATSFSELLERDLGRVDRVREAVRRDDEDFLRDVREGVEAVVKPAVSECRAGSRVRWRKGD
jgi:hypothetical protein